MERHRRADGHRARAPRAVRRQRRQGQPRRRGSPGGSAARPLRRGDRRDPHAARGGQDHDDGRARTGPRLHRAAGDHRHPAGLHGPHLRDQGRRGGRRLQPGGPLREPEPAPDGRPARGHGRQQPPGRHGGQPPLQRERARARSARRDVEARARRQRPLTPPHCERARDEAGRHAAGDRFRHHRGVRGDGRARARHVAARPAPAHGADRRGLHGGRRARHRRAAQGGRGHDGHHARCHQAQPAADAREHSGPRARRPLRQHRPRQLVGGGRPDRDPRRASSSSPRPGSGPTWARSGSSTSSAGRRASCPTPRWW